MTRNPENSSQDAGNQPIKRDQKAKLDHDSLAETKKRALDELSSHNIDVGNNDINNGDIEDDLGEGMEIPSEEDLDKKKKLAKDLGLGDDADWDQIREANREKFLNENNINEDLDWDQIEQYKKSQHIVGSPKTGEWIDGGGVKRFIPDIPEAKFAPKEDDMNAIKDDVTDLEKSLDGGAGESDSIEEKVLELSPELKKKAQKAKKEKQKAEENFYTYATSEGFVAPGGRLEKDVLSGPETSRDLKKDSKQDVLRDINQSEKGQYYKNKKEYADAVSEKLARKIGQQEWQEAVQNYWDSNLTESEKKQYGGVEIFQKVFSAKIREKLGDLSSDGVNISKEAVLGLVKSGYDVESFKRGMFGSIRVSKKNVEQVENSPKGFWAGLADKIGIKDIRGQRKAKSDVSELSQEGDVSELNQEGFDEWIEKMDVYGRNLINGKVKTEIDKRYDVGAKKFKDMVKEKRDDRINSTFEAAIQNTNDFDSLYDILTEKKIITGQDGKGYDSGRVIAILQKAREIVLNGKQSASEFLKKYASDRRMNQRLVMETARLMKEEMENRKKENLKLNKGKVVKKVKASHRKAA